MSTLQQQIQIRKNLRDGATRVVTYCRCDDGAKIKLYRSARTNYPTLCPVWLTVWVFDNCRFRVRERAGKCTERPETGRKV